MSKSRKRPGHKAKAHAPEAHKGPARESQDISPAGRNSLLLRPFVVVAGAVIMAMEIVGSRILAPYFGNSIFVWGSLITVFLFALSLGYFLGGMAADRWPSPRCIAAVGITGGLLILLIPFTADALCAAVVANKFGPRVGPLLCCALLFLPPCLVLAMTSPIAIRIEGTDLERLGNTAGSLYALSTLGSIIGTIGTAFFLIPAMGVRNIVITAGCLSIFSGTVMLPGRSGLVLPVTVALGLAAAGYGLACLPLGQADSAELYATQSHYHNISVQDADGKRSLRFDRFVESGIELTPPYNTTCMYTNMLHLALIFSPDPERILFVGGGGGVAPRRFRRDLPSAWIDVVEIDPAVIDVAREYFFFHEDARMKTYATDGRLFIRTASAAYNIMVLDAYTINGQVPFHLMTQQFLQQARARLTEEGVVIMNLISGLYGPQGKLYRAMLATFGQVFPQVYVFPRDYQSFKNTEVVRNIMIVGTRRESRLTHEDVMQTAHRLVASQKVTVPGFVEYAENLLPVEMTREDDLPALTDDHAPVELLQVSK